MNNLRAVRKKRRSKQELMSVHAGLQPTIPILLHMTCCSWPHQLYLAVDQPLTNDYPPLMTIMRMMMMLMMLAILCFTCLRPGFEPLSMPQEEHATHSAPCLCRHLNTAVSSLERILQLSNRHLGQEKNI